MILSVYRLYKSSVFIKSNKLYIPPKDYWAKVEKSSCLSLIIDF